MTTYIIPALLTASAVTYLLWTLWTDPCPLDSHPACQPESLPKDVETDPDAIEYIHLLHRVETVRNELVKRYGTAVVCQLAEHKEN